MEKQLQFRTLNFKLLKLDSNTFLLIKIEAITINTFLPKRNKFVYSCSIKIHASGFCELLENIFLHSAGCGSVFPAKSCWEAWRVVVGWWEFRQIWGMRQNFVAQLVQLLKCWLCDTRLGIVMKKNQSFLLTNAGCRLCGFQCNSSICWAYFLDIRFHWDSENCLQKLSNKRLVSKTDKEI